MVRHDLLEGLTWGGERAKCSSALDAIDITVGDV
jgi:hypothetical protein